MRPVDEKVKSYLVRARILLGIQVEGMNPNDTRDIIAVAQMIQIEENYVKEN